MWQARTVTARFSPVTYPLTINKTGNGQRLRHGSGQPSYSAGTRVT